MRRQIAVLLLLLSFVFSVSAQKPSDVEQSLRKHVEYLASDKLEGRRTGEPGAALAADYIAKAFAQSKLKPGFRDQKGKASFLQAFPYVTGVEMAATGNDFQLKFPESSAAAIAKPVGFSPNTQIANAKIVFPGYGIVSKEPVFDDYGDQDVMGKVVMVFAGNPDNGNPHSLFGRFDARAKARIAKDKGAVAVLLISREADLADDRLTRLEYDQTLGEAALPVLVISRETAAAILGVKAPDLVMMEEFVAMRKDMTGKVTVTLRDALPTLDFRVNLVKKQTGAHNVIGILEGTDPVLKNEAIVIGAHYDHLGRGGQGSLDVNSKEIHYGADDNASGTSSILELARQFAKEKKNKRTIIFIAFSGEEEGLLGSNFYVNNPVFPIEKTVAMINLDMVGRLKDHKLTIGGIGTANEWKGLIDAKNGVELPISSMIQPSTLKVLSTVSAVIPRFLLQLNEDGFGPSDHSSFYGKKIPVLFLFTGTHENYHKPSDTADKINYAGLTQITAFIGNVVRAIDQNQQKPTYSVAKSSGTMGRTGFSVSLGTVPNYADSTDGLLLDGVRDNSPAAKAGIKAG
ncbi:MAG: M28 family peptidase, partial [Saprospiraceae bacterium]|nr:M28 family peptidase [Pyrinomonadaceae bacterium]